MNEITKPRPEFVWKFDVNRRVYKPRGPATGGPIWREHWGKHRIIGENRVSYLLEFGGRCPKKPSDVHVFDEAQLDELAWAHEAFPRIRDAMRNATAAQLRAIDMILNPEETGK